MEEQIYNLSEINKNGKENDFWHSKSEGHHDFEPQASFKHLESSCKQDLEPEPYNSSDIMSGESYDLSEHNMMQDLEAQ